jgi:hypothetical protein
MKTRPLMLTDLEDIVDQISLYVFLHGKENCLTFLATNLNSSLMFLMKEKFLIQLGSENLNEEDICFCIVYFKWLQILSF